MSDGRSLPIDADTPDAAVAPLGRGMDRREFLGAATLAAVGAALAACGGDGGTGPSSSGGSIPAGTTLSVNAGSFPALGAVGGIATVGQMAGQTVAIVRTGASSYAGFSQRCTHLGCTVAVVTNGFSCEASRTGGCGHGSLYDAQGRVTRGPAGRGLQQLTVAAGAGGALTITA